MLQEDEIEIEKVEADLDTTLLIHRPDIWKAKQEGFPEAEEEMGPVEPESQEELEEMLKFWEQDGWEPDSEIASD